MSRVHNYWDIYIFINFVFVVSLVLDSLEGVRLAN